MPTYNEITLAKELIRFPSITPVDAGVMKFLAKKLTAIGFKCKILEFKDKNSKPVKNLYARLGNSQPNFMFAGHLDVVPPGNIKDWTIKPFSPTIKKNHLIGRGANDMKSAIASWVVAVNNYVLTNKKIAIIGYASRVISEHLTPKLTTIDQHGKKVGSTSARLLLKRLDEFDGEPESIIINSTVQKRFTS